ncbi:MAG: hypothetical protein NT120_03965, partial [Candidatus Aenigmarchaeota archaeon]|nr:hypothetical protein [Candidatus Aenigmarchaeota archaeon]
EQGYFRIWENTVGFGSDITIFDVGDQATMCKKPSSIDFTRKGNLITKNPKYKYLEDTCDGDFLNEVSCIDDKDTSETNNIIRYHCPFGCANGACILSTLPFYGSEVAWVSPYRVSLYLGENMGKAGLGNHLTAQDLDQVLKDGPNYHQSIDLSPGAQDNFNLKYSMPGLSSAVMKQYNFGPFPESPSDTDYFYSTKVTFDNGITAANAGEILRLFGKDYMITGDTSATFSGSSTDRLYFLADVSVQPLKGGSDVTIIRGGKSYTIILAGIINDGSAVVQVDGTTETIAKGLFSTKFGDLNIYVKYTKYNSADDQTQNSATLVIGSRLVLNNYNKARKGANDDNIDGTYVKFITSSGKLTGLTVYMGASSSQDNYLTEKGYYLDPLWKTFYLNFLGLEKTSGQVAYIMLYGEDGSFHKLTVFKAGTGSGRVTSSPAGLDCGTKCYVYANAQVTLTAVADTDSTFEGWEGDCGGKTAGCSVKMGMESYVTANFKAKAGSNYTLTVNNQGGGGAVVSSPAGINCASGSCSAKYPVGNVVTLTATPESSHTLGAWSGACVQTTGATCTLTIDNPFIVGVSFSSSLTPKAPSDLGVYKPTDSPLRLRLRWTDNSNNEDRFEIYKSVDGVNFDMIASTAGTTYTDDRIASGSTYWYKAVASNAAGSSAYSKVQQITVTPLTDPYYFFTLYNQKSGGIVTSSDREINCASGSICGTTYTKGTAVTLRAIPDNTHVFNKWTQACDIATGATCDLTIADNTNVSVVFSSNQKPNAPSNLGVNRADGLPLALYMFWSDNSNNEDGFKVYKSLDGINFYKAKTLTEDNTMFIDYYVQEGSTYWYKVTAFNDLESDYSNVEHFTIPMTILTAPTGLTATPASPTSVQLSWTDNEKNNHGFYIERSTSQSSGFVQISTLLPDPSFYSGAHPNVLDTTVTTGKTYYYRVRAYIGTSNSGYSNTASATPT